MSVRCISDILVGEDEDKVLCNVVKMSGNTKERERMGNTKEREWVHVSLTRDVSGVKVVHKEDRLLILLARPTVLEPQECVMVIPTFKLTSNSIQHIASVCQMPEVLTSVSTR